MFPIQASTGLKYLNIGEQVKHWEKLLLIFTMLSQSYKCEIVKQKIQNFR